MSINFLICSERSGSNLITKIMNSHSNICGPSPKHIFNPVLRNLFRYAPLERISNWVELLTDIHRLINVDFSRWKKTYTLEDLGELAQAGNVNDLLKNIFYIEAKMNGKQHLFIKENHIYEYLPYLLLNFPESKYVYQVRDPRDMALSWKKSKIHIGGVISGARQWQKDQNNSLKHFFLLRQFGKAILVKYEDLISIPEKVIKEAVEFLGFQFEENMFKYYEEDMVNKNSIKMATWENLSKPLLKRNMNKYKQELSEEEIMIIERICFFEMKVLGYESVYQWRDLEDITSEKINRYDKIEQKKMKTVRPNGVIKNIEAKKFFYQKIV